MYIHTCYIIYICEYRVFFLAARSKGTDNWLPSPPTSPSHLESATLITCILYVYICLSLSIYLYREREREREKQKRRTTKETKNKYIYIYIYREREI